MLKLVYLLLCLTLFCQSCCEFICRCIQENNEFCPIRSVIECLTKCWIILFHKMRLGISKNHKNIFTVQKYIIWLIFKRCTITISYHFMSTFWFYSIIFTHYHVKMLILYPVIFILYHITLHLSCKSKGWFQFWV